MYAALLAESDRADAALIEVDRERTGRGLLAQKMQNGRNVQGMGEDSFSHQPMRFRWGSMSGSVR